MKVRGALCVVRTGNCELHELEHTELKQSLKRSLVESELVFSLSLSLILGHFGARSQAACDRQRPPRRYAADGDTFRYTQAAL